MLKTYITSTTSLRTSGSRLPFSTNDYSHCSNETHPFLYSSSRPCCCCCFCFCSSPMHQVPVTSNYCYNFYGLRQSSLIQWSPYRRLIRGGFNRCYNARLPVCDVGGNCYCDRVCNFREKSVGRRKGGFRRCKVFDERSERYNIGDVDEAEVVLSLLVGDIDEECFCVKKETRRLLKKPVVEKSENKFGGQKKRVDVSAVESEGKRENKTYNSRKKGNRRREEVIWREEEKETLLREENLKERKDALTNRTAKEKEEKEALLRKPRRKTDEEQERESMLRKENWKVRSRTEEREDLLRREEQRQKVRRDGSSCTSYYSLSSTGDYESEHETDLREGKFWSERYNIGGVDETEVVFSLLVGDIDEECFRVEKETRRLLKKPVAEKSENKCGGKKKRVDVNAVESEDKRENKPTYNSRKKDNRRREEVIWREEEKETLLREENRKERKDALTNRTAREKEEKEALLRKPRRKADEEQERESMLRKENWKVWSRTEEREDLLRREEQKQKVRRDGSSCTSYYSLSSTGDYESEHETDLREGKFIGDSSSGHMRNSNIEIVHQNAREEYQRHGEDRCNSLTKKSREKEFCVGSSAVESDFRKKTEKKLTDISVEEMESSKKSSLKESNFSTARESNYEKVFDSYSNYDDRKVKPSESSKLDEERKQQLVQTGDEDSRQSETRLKYKQFVEMQDTHSDDVRNSYGSQKLYSGKSEMSAKVASQEKVGEIRAAVGLSTREDKYERNSREVSEVSESQEIDIRKASISLQRFETSVKEEDYSTNRVSGLGESKGTSHILIKEEDKLNLAYGSSLESKQTHSQNQAKLIRRVNSRNEIDEFITHSGNSGAISVDNRIKTKSETLVRPDTYDFSGGNSQFDSTEVRGHNEEKSPLSHHNSSHGQPSKFISQEDVIGSAARLEKSSAHYVDEFVNQVWSEISNSEIQREKKTQEAKFVHEEQHPEKNLLQDSSGDPHSPEHGLKDDDQPSGSKGPPDEMWKVDEQSVQKLPKPEIQDNASKPDNAIVKRNGKSLWNIFVNIVRLRWTPRSNNHSSNRKTGGRNSPNQSTSSETWVSGHEAEENEGTSITQGVSSRHQEIKAHSLVEEGSSSSTSEGYPKNVGVNAPSFSVVLETSEGNFGDTSAAIVDSSIAIPALRLRRFSAMRGALETGKENTSESGVSMKQPESVVNDGELKQKKLQRKDQVVKDRFDEWEEACRLEAEQLKIDEMFMREALLEAQKGADNWEVPVGAVLVHNRKIIARGCNLVEELRDSTAHAEVICIREGSNVLRTWRLTETTLYVTLEPCPMCAGAILQARIDTVVWGAPNKLLGADGSWIRLFPSGNRGNNDLEQTDKPAAPVHPFHPKIVVRRGVLASECADAMQQFFKLRRKDKKPETFSTPPSCLPISHRPSKFLAKMHDAFSFMFCL